MKAEASQHSLTGGGRVLMVHVPGSSVTSLGAFFNSGYYFGDPAKFEVPHVLEHLMGSGNKAYPTALEFKAAVEKNGAYRNASTSMYLNGYIYECAGFETDRMIDLLEAQITTPVLPEVSFATEISNVREELSRNTSDYSRLTQIQLSEQTQPRGSLNYTERIAQLPTIRLDEIRAYYERTHTAQNVYFCIAGDFGEHTALPERFERIASALPKGKLLRVEPQPLPRLDEPVVTAYPIEQIHFLIRTHFDDAKREQQRAFELLSGVLTGGYDSWLLGPAREQGLAYGIGSGFGYHPSISNFSIGSYVTPSNAKKLFELIAQAVTKLQQGKLSDGELSNVKDRIIGRSMRSVQTTGQLLDGYTDAFVLEGKLESQEDWHRELRAVNVEDIRLAAQRLAERPWAASFTGKVNKDKAGKLLEGLETIWKVA